jgi:transmembrane sensor
VLPGLVALAAAILVAVGIAIFVRYEGVVTRVGEHRLLVLEDGTRVSLNTATRVVVRYDKHARRIELKRGEAFFDVAKRSNWPFIVQAGDREVHAVGTAFAVRRERDRIAITLIGGKVTVTAGESRGELFALAPGQRLTFDAHKAPAMDAPSLETVIAWRRGEVVFDDTPLSVAVAEMNRYSETRLIVERVAAAEVPISGLFQAGDSVNFANAIARAYGLRISARHDEIVIGGVPQTAPASRPR